MSHMVIYRGADGSPGYHQTDDVHDAVGFVEKLRNEQGVEQARIFRLEEMNFEYRPYFRVELRAGDAAIASAPSAPAVAAAPAAPAAPPAPAAAPSGDGAPAAAPAADAAPAAVAEMPAESNESAEAGESAEPPRPITDAPSVKLNPPEGDNGVGARRGLFGR